MTIKLGELLIREKLLTSAQVEEALKYQVIFGGRLGTNLIEMDLLEEEVIARALSKKLGVPYIDPPDRLMKIPEDVLKLIPKETAKKYGVIPLKLDGRRLYLAMADPSDLQAIDEIAFRTGYVIRPVVVPEVRLILAMEKHYQVERKRRYIQAINKVESRKKEPRTGGADSNKPPAPKAPAPLKPLWEGTDPLEEIDILGGPAPAPGAPSPSETPRSKSVEESRGIPGAGHTLESVLGRMAEARDRDDITGAVSDFLGEAFVRGALFLVRGGEATGWKATVDNRPVEGFERFQVPLQEPSVLKMVADSKNFYLGPIPPTPINSLLLKGIGGKPPEAALLVPILMMGRVVSIIYADGSNDVLGGRLLELQRIASKAAMAYEILILKSKIRMM